MSPVTIAFPDGSQLHPSTRQEQEHLKKHGQSAVLGSKFPVWLND